MQSLLLSLLFIAALITLLATNWRGKLLSLLAQYLIVVVFVGQVWPLGLAAVKGIAALIVIAILAYTELSLDSYQPPSDDFSTGVVFKLFAFSLLAVLVISVAPPLTGWIPALSPQQSIAGFLLIGAGLIQIALNSRILPTVVGLLSLFSGFELIYATVEISSLLAGLLALINLAIALVGAFLLLLPTLEPSE